MFNPNQEQDILDMLASWKLGKKVTELDVQSGLSTDDVIEIQRDGLSKQSTLSDVIDLSDSFLIGSNASKKVYSSERSDSDSDGNDIGTTYAKKTEIGQGMLAGFVYEWFGAFSDIPDGFVFCNGNNGVLVNGYKIPDLRGRWLVGYDPTSPATPAVSTDTSLNYGAVGNTGGLNNVVLTIPNLPSHSHSVNIYENGTQNNNGYIASSDNPSISKGTSTSTSVGGGIAHENRPPYVVGIPVMKVS